MGVDTTEGAGGSGRSAGGVRPSEATRNQVYVRPETSELHPRFQGFTVDRV